MLQNNHDYISNEIIHGDGYVIIRNLLNSTDIKKISIFIRRLLNNHQSNTSNFQRVFGIENSFIHNLILPKEGLLDNTFKDILGDTYKLQSMCVDRLTSGNHKQEPHVDYPYWTLYNKSNFSKYIDYKFVLGMQCLIAISNFSKEQGSTYILPGSQKYCEYPEEKVFNDNAFQVELTPGDIIIFHGLIWHCAGENFTEKERLSILLNVTPEFVAPMKY